MKFAKCVDPAPTPAVGLLKAAVQQSSTMDRRASITEFLSVFAAWVCVASATMFFAADAWAVQPKLVVQITIDQLRGDMPSRFKDRFGEGCAL